MSFIADPRDLNCPCSVAGIATGYRLDDPGIESQWGARFFAPVQTDPGARPSSCTMFTGSFPGVKSTQGVTLTPHPLLVPLSRKGRAIPLLPLWALRPVQSLKCLYKSGLYFMYVKTPETLEELSLHLMLENCSKMFPACSAFG